MRTFSPLSVKDTDVRVLREWADEGSVDGGGAVARRARIVLLSGAGHGPSAVAEQVGCSKQTVITWRERYRAAGLAGLRDAPRSGRPATVDPLVVVTRTLEAPGPGVARWSTRTLAADLGISNVAVANIWRAWGVSPAAGGRVRLATEPVLDRPVAAVLGMYLGRHTRVLAIALRDPAPRDPVQYPTQSGSGRRRLPAVDSRPVTGEDPAALEEFLERLGRGPSPALLVESAPDHVRRWVGARRGAVLHTAAAAVPWSRLVRVACLAAGGTATAERSVAALAEALDEHDGDGAFSWTLCRRGELAEIHVAG